MSIPPFGDLAKVVTWVVTYVQERKNPLIIRGEVRTRPSWAMVFRTALPRELANHFGHATNNQVFSWARDAGGVEVSSQLLRLTLRGNARTPVVIDDVDVDVRRRVEVKWQTEVWYPTAGGTSAEMLWVSLEDDGDFAAKLMELDGGAPTFHSESFAAIGRTLEVSKSHEEVIMLLVMSAPDQLVDYAVRIGYHVGDRRGSVTWPDFPTDRPLSLAGKSPTRKTPEVWLWGELEGAGRRFVRFVEKP